MYFKVWWKCQTKNGVCGSLSSLPPGAWLARAGSSLPEIQAKCSQLWRALLDWEWSLVVVKLDGM